MTPTPASDPAREHLGPLHTVTLPSGPLRYRDTGSGIPVLFLAGLMLSSGFWRRVVPAITHRIRALVPDLPLGAHTVPMHPDADLSPVGIADLTCEFLEALGVDEAVIVGNDTGGVIAKLLCTRHPQRASALVLTSCESFENFLPPLYRYLQVLPYLPGAMWSLSQVMRLEAPRRLPIAFGWLTTRRPLEKPIYDAYLTPGRVHRGVCRDAGKVLRGIRRRYTVEAAAQLSNFDRPTLIAWATEDRVFPYRHAEMLAGILPDVTLVPIEDSYTYIPEDQPLVLAGHIDRFLAERLGGELAVHGSSDGGSP